MSTFSSQQEKQKQHPNNYFMFSFSMPFMLLNIFLKSLKAILYKFRKDNYRMVWVGKEPLNVI